MKYILTILIVSALSCNSNSGSQANIEERAKQYMKDSIVPRFNDPTSYQFVSLKVDTLTGADYLKNLQRSYIDTDTSLLGTDTYNEKLKEMSDLSVIPGYADSVLLLNIIIEYRGKNKMGALILDKSELRYFPKEDRLTLVQ